MFGVMVRAALLSFETMRQETNAMLPQDFRAFRSFSLPAFPVRSLRLLLLCLGLGTISLSSAVPAQSINPVASLPGHQVTSARKPVISKIDPPDWWVPLPDPMLLIHGENLSGATFTVLGGRIALDVLKTSSNGHWAFVTLHTGHSGPAKLTLQARTDAGSATVQYTLRARLPTSEQPRGFSPADVMYLIMPDRFADADPAGNHLSNFKDPDDRSLPRAYHGGDLRGIEQHLDYLQSTGITTIWTTPLYDNTANQSRDTYHGYSATDMFAVDPHLGTLADYQHLARAAHSRGMKIVLDTVPNHVGPGSPWVADPPTPDWFHGSAAHHTPVDDDFASVVDPHATPARRVACLDGWFANVLPDLNQGNPLVARYLIQNAIWWVESVGLDGLRIDTFPYVPRSFWHLFHEQLHSLYPALTTVGEVFNRDPTLTSFFAGGEARTGSDGTVDTGLYTPFDYPMYFALRDTLLRHAPMTELAGVLRQDSLYPHPERLVTFLGNHDTGRFLSEPGATPATLHLAFGLLATMRGMPQIYYGDEIGMTGGDDPENRHDFPGGFPGDRGDAFTSQGRTRPEAAIYQGLTALLKLRQSSPALQSGDQQNLLADQTAFAFVRGSGLQSGCSSVSAKASERVLILINNSPTAREVVLPAAGTALEGCTRFTPALADGAHVVVKDAHVAGTLAPYQIDILKVQ